MLKIITAYIVIGFSISLMANVPKNDTCKGCHPTIYKEFTKSAHKKSTIYNDAIHKSVWDIHPASKKNKYACAKCHTPTDTRVLNALKEDKPAVLSNDSAQNEGISCVSCHSINSIEKHAKPHDKNILIDNNNKRPTLYAASEEKRGTTVKYETKSTFLGMFKSTTGSPYHDIDYSNDIFYNGKVCMGCHSHKENKHNQNICTTEAKGAIDEKSNCITCHMPQVQGSATTIVQSKTHTFHGFSGTRNKPEMLAKYLKIDYKQTTNGFAITLKNEATHNLLLHPLRLGKLNIKIRTNDRKIKVLKSIPFLKVLGHKGKPAMPWIATEIYKDNMLKAGEVRTINYDTAVTTGDNIEVEFGYYLVNPKVQKKLNLINNEEATRFNILKRKLFIVK
jgi:hypothetical protein